MLGAAALGLSACLPSHSLFSLYVNHTRSSKEDLWLARPSWLVEFRRHLSYFLSSILLSFIKTLHLFFCPWLLSHHPLLVSVPFSWLTLPGLFCHGSHPLCLAIKGRSSPRPLLPVDSPLGSVSVHPVWTTLWNTWLSIQLSSWHLCLHSTCARHGSISAHTHSPRRRARYPGISHCCWIWGSSFITKEFWNEVIGKKWIWPITSCKQMGKQWKQWQTLFSWAPKSLQMVTAAMKLKDACSLEEKPWQT